MSAASKAIIYWHQRRENKYSLSWNSINRGHPSHWSAKFCFPHKKLSLHGFIAANLACCMDCHCHASSFAVEFEKYLKFHVTISLHMNERMSAWCSFQLYWDKMRITQMEWWKSNPIEHVERLVMGLVPSRELVLSSVVSPSISLYLPFIEPLKCIFLCSVVNGSLWETVLGWYQLLRQRRTTCVAGIAESSICDHTAVADVLGFCNAWFGLSWANGTFTACAGTSVYPWITKFRSYWYLHPSHKSDNCVVQPNNYNATPSDTFKCYCIFSVPVDLCTMFWLNVQCSGNCLITLLLVMPNSWSSGPHSESQLFINQTIYTHHWSACILI